MELQNAHALTPESASSTSQNQRRLKATDEQTPPPSGKTEGKKASWEMHGDVRYTPPAPPDQQEKGVQESPFIPNTVLLTFSPTDKAQLSPQSLHDLIEGTASWSSSAKLVVSFTFPCLVTQKSFQTP